MAQNDSWHVKKEVNLGHIVTTLSVIVGVLYWSADVNNQITSLRREDQIIHERVNDVRTDTRVQFAEIKSALLRIEEKLDKKADK